MAMKADIGLRRVTEIRSWPTRGRLLHDCFDRASILETMNPALSPFAAQGQARGR